MKFRNDPSNPMRLMVWCLMLAIPWSAMALQNPCQDEGNRTVDELIERWKWESFWNGGTSGFRYQPRANATVDVFWNAELIGMCSLEIGSCTAYERTAAPFGQFVTSADRLRVTDLHQATKMFLRK